VLVFAFLETFSFGFWGFVPSIHEKSWKSKSCFVYNTTKGQPQTKPETKCLGGDNITHGKQNQQ
jgi:hypothetical protein